MGHLDWSDNDKLYEEIVRNLAKKDKVSASGLICNAPQNPTPYLLAQIVYMLDIDTVLVIDNESMQASLQAMFQQPVLGSNGERRRVECVPLQKSGGVMQSTFKEVRMLRTNAVKNYFYGVNRELHPHSIFVNLADVNLVTLEVSTLPSNLLPHGQQEAKVDEFRVSPFGGNPQHLQHALLAVVCAKQVDDVRY